MEPKQTGACVMCCTHWPSASLIYESFANCGPLCRLCVQVKGRPCLDFTKFSFNQRNLNVHIKSHSERSKVYSSKALIPQMLVSVTKANLQLVQPLSVLCELCRTLRLFLQHIFLGVPSRCCECLWSSLHSLGLNSWGRDLHSFNSLTWASGLSLRVLMEEFVACFWACFGFPVKLCDLTQQELGSALRLRSASLQTDSIMNLSAIFTGSRRSCWIKVPAGRGSPLEFAGSLLF